MLQCPCTIWLNNLVIWVKINSESFKYKTSITGSTYNVDAKITNVEGDEINNPAYDANKSAKKEVEIAVPLKYLSDFWRTLDMSLIKKCVTRGVGVGRGGSLP